MVRAGHWISSMCFENQDHALPEIFKDATYTFTYHDAHCRKALQQFLPPQYIIRSESCFLPSASFSPGKTHKETSALTRTRSTTT